MRGHADCALAQYPVDRGAALAGNFQPVIDPHYAYLEGVSSFPANIEVVGSVG